ncbi:hypothetical protein E1B28_001159 [Marasmius oreades]|uniref:DH domain-containing protein n=1 Tax=Marasmius oreades TaxID=181124 RepID=A0A9P7V2X8_9AGAR|nr:uncharacterized protein E1B28_001159 [Marasmius oreades]KAG7099301.1 hypothetical protein E1B28_001159 [Marasmius oreades]
MDVDDRPPQLNLILEPSSLGLPLSLPATPSSPAHPQDSKPKKANPLNDLIDTEKAYTDLLGGVIKKVAAAWSRSNMPPPKLDTMFRSIESVYRSNRSLLAKLREIGTSSPKALGDLLIRWVDDLEGPYTSYCTQYRSGFDHWEPVQVNTRLAPILESFSAANPPPTSSNADPSVWSLDDLFLLPKGRLKYYKKLYSRLLKSTQAGKSDHRLLVEALDKLEKLLAILDERDGMKVETPAASPKSSPPVLQPEEETVIDMKAEQDGHESSPVHRSDPNAALTSEDSLMRESGESGSERVSQGAPSSSTSRSSSSTLSMPVTDLERRLSTQRTLDIFTMTPKMVKLQMSPPALTFTREFRCSVDITIRLTPRSTGVEVVYQRGHIFLLSDLFLICSHMTPQERAEHGVNGADMWLMYPPLSGKVLRVSEPLEQDNTLQVHIMRKETIVLTADSVAIRDNLYAELKGCIEFAASVGPVSKQPPPPVPPLPGLSASTSLPHPSSPSFFQASPSSARSSDSSHFSSSVRTSSPPTLNGYRGSHSSSKTPEMGPSPRSSSGVDSVTGQFANMAMPPPIGPRMSPQGPGPFPPVASPPLSIGPGQVFRNPSMTHAPGSPPPSLGPSQVFRNPRSFTHGPGSPPPSVGSGQVLGPPRTASVGQGGPAPGPPIPRMGGPSPPFSPQQSALNRPNPNQTPMYPPGQQQMFAPRPMHRPYGPMGENSLPPIPPRPPSEPSSDVIHKSLSTRSLNAAYQQGPPRSAPPMPNMPPGTYPPYHDPGTPIRPGMNDGLHPISRPTLPSSQFKRAVSNAQSFADPSPPSSPVEETPKFSGPTTLTISANMKCKVFLKQQHQQWKSLGSARLKLYTQSPTNIKQLVVEADSKDHTVLISTIVLTDGVERVGKTGVAVELSDKGARTGIVYMLQLRSDEFAGGLFDSLLEGSDRSGLR